MIHNIPQPVLEHELTNRIAEDPNIALYTGFSIHAVHQVHPRPLSLHEPASITTCCNHAPFLD